MQADDAPDIEPAEEAVQAQLAAERAARETAEREVAALKAEKRLLEYRVINANRTLAYGLGRALIEARSLKGLLSFPSKVRRLRLKQKAKRKARVPDSFEADMTARLALVDPVLDKAKSDGAETAARWLRAQPGDRRAKGRALAELALSLFPGDPALAARLGTETADSVPDEPRLVALMVALGEAGLVRAPAMIAEAIEGFQPLSLPQKELCEGWRRDAALLDRGSAEPLPEHAPGVGSDRQLALILCPARWQQTLRVEEAARTLTERGFDLRYAAVPDAVQLSQAALVHIFPDTLDAAEAAMRTAREAGAPAVLDMGGVPRALRDFPNREAGQAARLRFEALDGKGDVVVARGETPVALPRVALRHIAPLPLMDDAVATAFEEFGLDREGATIACAAELDDASGALRCLEAFVELAAVEEAQQLVVIGIGGKAGVVRREATKLGVGDAVRLVGMPAPARWRALLAGIDLVLLPDMRIPTLESEIPLFLETALEHGNRVLATSAAWTSQARVPVDAGAVLANDSPWTVAVRQALVADPTATSAVPDAVTIAEIYEKIIHNTVK